MALPFSGHGVTLGGLELVAWGEGVTHDEGFTTEISADGTTWGNPAVVVSSLISALSDGDIVQQQRAGNREPVLYVRIIGSDHHSLVAGDTALSAVVGGPCELVWQPPDVDAPPTVIDVVHSRMDHAWDDMDALKFERVWTVTMSALPWPRSATKVKSSAVVAATPTVVDSGSSATNWTAAAGPAGASVSVVSDAVRVTYDPSLPMTGDAYGVILRRTAPLAVSTSRFIGVDWRSSNASAFNLQTSATFGSLGEVLRGPATVAGFTRSWFEIPAGVTSTDWLQFVVRHNARPSSSAILEVDQVFQADALPAIGTTRQLVRTIDPGGSVPAEGDIIVEHPSTGLGHAVVYSHPVMGGYSPPLRQWLHTSAAVTASPSNTYSGAFHSLTTATLYLIPTDAIPQGDVHLWARVQRTAATGLTSIDWKAQSGLASGADVGDAQQGTTEQVLTTNVWTFVPLARLSLPVTRINSGTLGIEITVPDGGVLIDEAWLFAMDRGRLTVVQCGDGTPTTGVVANRLKISAPSLEEPNGSIMVGTAADFSDAHTPAASQILCDQTGHRFDPDGSAIFTATAAEDAAVSLEHYPRWRAEAS